MLNKSFFRKLHVQIGLSVMLFILVVELVLLVFSYHSREAQLRELNGQIEQSVFEMTGKKIEAPLNEAMIQAKLEEFTINVIGLVAIIIAVVVAGTSWIVHLVVGRHVLRLKENIEKSSLKNPYFYPEEFIPNNELGDVIRSRDINVKEIQQATAREAILADIAAGISHEINTPLNVVSGNAKLLRMTLEDEKPNPDELNEYSQVIERTVMRIARIVKGIHLLSRDAGEDCCEAINVAELLAEVKDFSFDKIQKSDAVLTIESVDSDVIVRGRSYQIFQVILNLVKNAADAICDLPDRWIRIEVEKFEDSIIFHVMDSGKGIPDEIKDKLLQPYFTTKSDGKGTGLGLALAKSIMERHQGSLEIGLRNGHTCFSLVLAAEVVETDVAEKLAA